MARPKKWHSCIVKSLWKPQLNQWSLLSSAPRPRGIFTEAEAEVRHWCTAGKAWPTVDSPSRWLLSYWPSSDILTLWKIFWWAGITQSVEWSVIKPEVWCLSPTNACLQVCWRTAEEISSEVQNRAPQKGFMSSENLKKKIWWEMSFDRILWTCSYGLL